MILIKMHREPKSKLIYSCSFYVNAIKSMCALSGIRQASATVSAVVFISKKSVQGKWKIIQFSFTCSSTV